jgi:chemotaxis-related protein WspD
MEAELEHASPAQSLLHREPSPELIGEWTAMLASRKDTSAERETISVVVFRCCDGWFALSDILFDRICESRIIRRVPFRSGESFEGLANVDGELCLCFSLTAILGLTREAGKPAESPSSRRRLCLICYQSERAAFQVEEVLGQRKIPLDSLKAAPANVTNISGAHTNSFCMIDGRPIGLLDPSKLMTSIRRVLSW